MPDKSTDLAIIIEAVNNASKDLKQVEKDLAGMSDAVEEQGKAAKTASAGFGQLVAGVATGTIVANIALGAFNKLTRVLTDIPGIMLDIAFSAGEVNQAGIGMLIVANNAGIMSKEVLKVRDNIVDMNVTTRAANTLLRDLIKSEIDYSKATELVAATQNIASATGLSTSEAIERVSHAISSGIPWSLRELGIKEDLNVVYDRYAAAIDKSSDSLTQAQKKTAIMNLVLREGTKFVGAYEASMSSASKVAAQTRDRIKEVAFNLGSLLEPALLEGSRAVKEFVENILTWAKENQDKLRAIAQRLGDFMRGAVESINSFIKSINWDFVMGVLDAVISRTIAFGNVLRIVSNVVQVISRVFIGAIKDIQSFGSALGALAQGDLEGLKNVYSDWRDSSLKTANAVLGDIDDITNAYKSGIDIQELDLKEWWDNVEGIEGSGWKELLRTQKDGLDEMTSQQKNALKKMLKDIEKANRDYQRAVEKRVKNFEESFDDLVLAHRDTIESLTDDLKEESREYDENVKDLLGNYTDAMDDMKDSHKKKTASVIEDIEEERKKSEEEIEKITEKYNEGRVLIEREGEARLGNLKAQLDKEVALGDIANTEKIKALEQMIAHEDQGLAGALDDKKTKHDKEVSDIEDALSEKLSKLEQELNEEKRIFTESMDDRKVQYESDLLSVKESYEEKRQALQEELNKELIIREQYASDFERLADMVAEDDLSRLVRKHGEEMTEMKRDHNEKLETIRANAFEQGLNLQKSFASGMDQGYPEFKAKIDRMNRDLTNFSHVYEDSVNMVSWLPGSAPWENNQNFSPMRAFKHGGLATSPGIVGEAGPEIVLPLNFPKKMGQIMQSMGMGGGNKEVVQNFYVTVNNQQDVDVLMERAGFALQNGGN